MYSAIQTGNNFGMQTLDQNLADLVRRNIDRAGRSARQGQDSRRTSRAEPLPATGASTLKDAMERDQASKFINDLLRADGRRATARDLFLTADFPPAIKVDGKVTKVSPQPLTGQHTLALTRSIMNDKQAAEFERTKECNFAIAPPGIGRFRVNAFVQQGNVGLVLRTIPQMLPTIDSLNLPHVLKDVAMTKRGLVIFVGATGSGKSTSLAAMVDYRNENSLRPHHHDRGPGRVRAPAQELHRHPARGRHRHRRLGSGAEEHAAPGARRHPDGRDPRPRDDGARRRLRRDRPPVHGHAARQQRQPGARPDHQLLPRRAARRSC